MQKGKIKKRNETETEMKEEQPSSKWTSDEIIFLREILPDPVNSFRIEIEIEMLEKRGFIYM